MSNSSYHKLLAKLLALVLTFSTFSGAGETVTAPASIAAVQVNPNAVADDFIGAGEAAVRRLLNRAEALGRSDDATLAKYPDADEVLLGGATRIDYRPDGTYTQWDEQYIKILTEKGRRENATVASYYTIPYQLPEDCFVAALEIIKPDGAVVSIDIAAQSSTSINSGSMGANIYNPNDKVITVNVPGLAVGDIVHFLMFDNTRLPRARGIFADAFSLEQTRPLLWQSVEINAPKSLPLKKIAVRDEIRGTIETFAPDPIGEVTRHRWIIRNVPQAFPEANMPPLFACTQRLLVSTAADWEEISRWYADLCATPLADVSPAMQDAVHKIVGDETDPREKIQRLFTWVSQKIRYVGVTTEETAPGYEPHPVKDTFSEKHGVCRDKAALLVAMLRLAGIEAFPVLIDTNMKKDAEVAQPFFNHAVTAALVNGEYMLMDSTDENTRTLLPDYLSDKSYLVAAANGEKLRVSPTTPAAENMLTIDSDGELSPAGDLKVDTTIQFAGINDNLYRGYFARITPNERRRYFEGVVKAVYGGAELTAFSLTPDNPLDTAEPLFVRLQFAARNIAIRGRNLALLPAPFLGARVGAVNFMLGQMGLEKRRFPLVLDSTCGVSETIKIDLPAEFSRELSMPVYKPVETPALEWRRSLARVGKSLRGKNEFILREVEISPEQYAQVKEQLKTVEYNARKLPVFAQSTSRVENEALLDKQADSVFLADDVEYEVLDAHSWRERRTTRKKILTYAGLKDESELKIAYNPAVENVTLERAVVIAPNGKVQTIAASAVNIMDQSWNGDAPRYPGGKILVANLPNVEIGSIVEYRVLREISRQPFFFAAETFREFSPIVARSVTLRAPAGMNIPVETTLNVHETRSVDDSAPLWEIANEPQMKYEDFLPPLGSFTPMWFAGSGEWRNYAASVRETLFTAAKNQPNAAAKGSALGKKLTLAGLRALVDDLATTIRRTGPAFGDLPLTATMTPADKTLADGYGNSADGAALWLALLAAAPDAQPELFLVSQYRAGVNLSLPQLQLPNPQMFNGVLLRLTVEGRTVWLNDIDQYSQLGATPSDGLVALNLQTGAFETVRNDKHFTLADETTYHIALKADGEATIRKTALITGNHYHAYKKLFAEMRPEEKRRHHQTELANLAQAATAASDYVTDFSAYPGKIEFTARVPKYAVEDNGFLYLGLPETLRRLFDFRSAKRTNPLFIGEDQRLRINTVITLPENFRPLIYPPKLLWHSPIEENSRVEIETRYGGAGAGEGNVLRVTQNAQLTATYYDVALYPELLKIQAALTHGDKRTVLLVTKEWVELQKVVGE
ncbi:MAG: DUF3857 domain-containing protein [Planctomycetota bacterium]|jgi:transglutaminase-like putative cysteine protease|nr:DUF3857 domain-containing protein [Planctomycetota bacterium]